MIESAAVPHLAKGMVSKKLGVNGLTERQSAFCWLWMFGDPGIRHNTQVCYGPAFAKIDQPKDQMTKRQAWLAHEYGNRLLQTPKISAQIERYRTQLMMQTDLARPSWIADALKLIREFPELANDPSVKQIESITRPLVDASLAVSGVLAAPAEPAGLKTQDVTEAHQPVPAVDGD